MKNKTYVPIIVIFIISTLLSFATKPDIMSFMGFFLTILATLKLIDLKAFANSFKKYDLLTKRLYIYGYLYPFLEVLIGLTMICATANEHTQVKPLALSLIGFISLIVGLVGSVSVFKAVYLDKVDFNCACVGGNSSVPLGAVSLLENISMAVMGAYLILTL